MLQRANFLAKNFSSVRDNHWQLPSESGSRLSCVCTVYLWIYGDKLIDQPSLGVIHALSIVFFLFWFSSGQEATVIEWIVTDPETASIRGAARGIDSSLNYLNGKYVVQGNLGLGWLMKSIISHHWRGKGRNLSICCFSIMNQTPS